MTDCINEINELLLNRSVRNVYDVTTAGLTAEESGRIGISEARHRTVERNVEDDIVRKSDYELCNIILYHTKLPRFAIFRILDGIEKKILLSNQDILDLATKRILQRLNDAKAAAINGYEIIKGFEFDDKVIFEADVIDEAMLEAEKKKVYRTKEAERRAVNKYYRVDSDGEYAFAESLDDDPNVLLYTKIKKGGFVINTPYGDYSPDWAIAYKNNDGSIRLYFIVETKFEKEWRDLTEVERVKIQCGTLHFEAIDKTASDIIKFDWANSYGNFKTKADRYAVKGE